MKFMPLDDPITGPFQQVATLATFLTQDWIEEDTDHRQLVAEAEDLLVAVDLAISGAELSGDKDGELMQRSWAFIGAGLYKDIQQLKTSSLQKGHLIPRIAVITIALTTRRQTLELNGIEVLKKAQPLDT